MSDRVVAIGPIQATRTESGHRVTADVGGSPAWFESPDLELAPAVEGFGSAFLVPALHHHARLRLGSAADPVWRANTTELLSILRSWWRYPAWPVETPRDGTTTGVSVARAPAEAPNGPHRARGALRHPSAAPTASTGLFFSGGVDSFHVLLRGEPRPNVVVMLQGFDIPLEDLPRARAAEASMRQVAAATGSRAVVVRSNARLHPLMASTPWERTHGGVLAGVAQRIAPATRRVSIAASAPGDVPIPWGSHARIDGLWSSSRVSVAHANAGSRRIDKLREIAAHPLVREHLRVCWRNLVPTGNCSRCSKCVLAMLILEECGELVSSRVFEGRDELAARIDGVAKARDRAHTFEELAASPRLDPTTAAAARRLVQRSRHAMRPDVRFRRSVVRWLVGRKRMPGTAG